MPPWRRRRLDRGSDAGRPGVLLSVLTTEKLDGAAFQTRLEGGPVVLSERIESVRSVALGIWFRQGRIHDPAGLGGISHFLEHMVFKGTGRRSALDLVQEIEALGGSLDAYTTHEHTAYQVRIPAEALGDSMDVLCDLAFRPRLAPADVESERQVILEELASIEDAPDEVAYEMHARALYGSHPYGEPIIGSRESVERVDDAALRSLHARAYRGGGAVVAAAGYVDHEALVDLVRGHIGTHDAPELPGAVPPPAAGPGELRETRPGGTQAHIISAGLTVPHRSPLRYAVVLVSTALGGGMSSRLFQRLREELSLAYSVYSFHSFLAEGGHAGAYVGTQPSRASAAREALCGELARLADHGLTRPEIESARQQLKGQVLIALESTSTRMNRLAGVALYDEPFRTMDEIIAAIDAVTEADVEEAARMFHPDRATLLTLSPE